MTTEQVTQFQVGKTYDTTSVCNSDCHIRHTVVKRTAKMITVRDADDVNATAQCFRVSVYDGQEIYKPWGSYSRCPYMRAQRDAV